MINLKRIKMRAGLAADLEQIPKSAGSDDRDACAFALDKSIGSDSGAVTKPFDVARVDTEGLAHFRKAVGDCGGGIARCRWYLKQADDFGPRVVRKEVGKGAPDVDAYQPSHA